MTCKKTACYVFKHILLLSSLGNLTKGEFRFRVQLNPFTAAMVWMDKAKSPICFLTNLICPNLTVWAEKKNMGKNTGKQQKIPKIASVYRQYYHGVGNLNFKF
jgi:hypothetical protein